MSIVSEAPSSATGRDPIWLRAVLVAGVLVHLVAILSFLWLTAHRVGYPLELGHVEGVLMDTVRRLVTGQNPYPAPTLDFMPLAYMPGYFLVTAPFVQWFGTHLWVGRAVALVETLVLAVLIARIIYRETGSRAMALSGPALFLGAYGFCGGSYDLVQPNSQLVLFAILGVALLRERTGMAGAIASGVCLGLAFLTKQHGLLFGLAMLPWLALHDRRRLLPFTIAFAAIAAGGYAIMAAAFGPWFTFYTYDVPSHWSEFDLIRTENLGRYVFGVFGVSASITLIALLPARGSNPRDRQADIWWWCAAGGLATGVLATLDPYSFRHTLMPMVAALAIVAPLSALLVARRLEGSRLPRVASVTIALWLLALQYVPLLYSVRRYIPETDGRALRAAFYDRLHAIPSRAMILNHGFYLRDAGGRPSVHLLALEDILRSNGNDLLEREPDYFDRQFATLISGPSRPWLVTDVPLPEVGDLSNRYWRVIAEHYALRDSFPSLADALLPSAGLQQSPRYVYAPIEVDQVH
jgi:hypothetical protein